MKRRFLSPVVAALLLVSGAMPIAKQPPTPAVEAQEYGPAKGTLVIVGGGNLNGSGILEKFIELAGGPEKKFVIVPTAGGNKNAQGEVVAYEEPRIIASWQRLGVKNVRMLHTHDAKMA